MTDRYAVMGNPIAHSKSPRIHRLFAEQTGEQLSYEPLLVPLDGFTDAVNQFFNAGGKGLNVTVPFKEQAWQLAEVRSRRAEKAGAVNTLLLGKDERIYGDNTDGVGLVRDLIHNHGLTLKGARVLVLGAGGAVRGILSPLLSEMPECVVIANRTEEKAQQLASLFADEGLVYASSYAGLEGRIFDVVINGTSASLGGDVPPLPAGILAYGACCYDMMYGAEPTAFLQWAKAQGVTRLLDGLGMLVEQAAEAFSVWRQKRPDTAPVLQQLRQELQGS